MLKTLTYIACCLILVTGSFVANAQETPSVKAAVDRNQILIGEPIRFTIDIKSPMVSDNQLPQVDSIPHFETIERANPDSVISAAGASYHLEWKLTSFDSGTRVIPSYAVVIGKQLYKTDSLAIEVSYGKLDTAGDYHDIKGIIEVENQGMKYVPWIVGAVALISLAVFIWMMRKRPTLDRQPSTVNRQPVVISPLEEALASLDQLKKLPLDQPANVKKYYFGLSDTLRIFLNHRLGLVTMEKTSEELIISISRLNLEKEKFSNLAAALRMGDFVKFAKYIPGPYENEQNMDVIRKSIVEIDESEKK